QSGVWGKPTCVNNVETFANIPAIINKGGHWFKKIGTEKSPGTKVFALAGKINNVGLVEVPMGTTMRDIVFDIGGGIRHGKQFKAVQTGGPSGGCIPYSQIDIPVDYDSLVSIGSMMGSGGLIVLDEDDCMVNIAKFYMEFIIDESCGKCTPCRVGTKRLHEILTKITEGKATEECINHLVELSDTIKDTSLCGLGQTAPNPVLSTISYFLDEYKAHVIDKHCPAGVCEALLSYTVVSENCIGCTACLRACPVNCIKGAPKEIHKIVQSDCIKCGACYDICRFEAIMKK
ncbi:4Fe-4S binding protein, partial [bacterium AH-315-E09]|nr:4Fe-4S binding protein [bacterium AH-315-E09]